MQWIWRLESLLNHHDGALVESVGESPSHLCFLRIIRVHLGKTWNSPWKQVSAFMYERFFVSYLMLLSYTTTVAHLSVSLRFVFSSSTLATRLPLNQINSQQIESYENSPPSMHGLPVESGLSDLLDSWIQIPLFPPLTHQWNIILLVLLPTSHQTVPPNCYWQI